MSTSAEARFVAKQRRASARRLAGQLYPGASKAERREEKRARRAARREAARRDAQAAHEARVRAGAAAFKPPGGAWTVVPEAQREGRELVAPLDPVVVLRRRPSGNLLAMLAAVASLGGPR